MFEVISDGFIWDKKAGLTTSMRSIKELKKIRRSVEKNNEKYKFRDKSFDLMYFKEDFMRKLE